MYLGVLILVRAWPTLWKKVLADYQFFSIKWASTRTNSIHDFRLSLVSKSDLGNGVFDFKTAAVRLRCSLRFIASTVPVSKESFGNEEKRHIDLR